MAAIAGAIGLTAYINELLNQVVSDYTDEPLERQGRFRLRETDKFGSADRAAKLTGTSETQTHSEPEKSRQSHYAGRSFRKPEKQRTYTPTTGPVNSLRDAEGNTGTDLEQSPSEYTGTGTEQTDTGAHTGSAGPHSGHPHTYGPRAPTDTTKDVTTVRASPSPLKSPIETAKTLGLKSMSETFTGRPRRAEVGDIIAREVAEKLKKEKLSGLPEVTSSNEKLVRLARASYINEINKYNTVY
jgi:hypothetical protein